MKQIQIQIQNEKMQNMKKTLLEKIAKAEIEFDTIPFRQNIGYNVNRAD
jgi:hypothetical protein